MKTSLATALLLSALAIPSFANAAPLITPDEAKLPTPPGAVSMSSRGVMRGPKVQLVSPDGAAAPLASPLHLQLKFESFGGTSVDPSSVKVIYVKTPAVDLTPRVQAYLKPTGIDFPNAEIPPGNHSIRVEIKDSDGRAGTASFNLKIAP